MSFRGTCLSNKETYSIFHTGCEQKGLPVSMQLAPEEPTQSAISQQLGAPVTGWVCQVLGMLGIVKVNATAAMAAILWLPWSGTEAFKSLKQQMDAWAHSSWSLQKVRSQGSLPVDPRPTESGRETAIKISEGLSLFLEEAIDVTGAMFKRQIVLRVRWPLECLCEACACTSFFAVRAQPSVQMSVHGKRPQPSLGKRMMSSR